MLKCGLNSQLSKFMAISIKNQQDILGQSVAGGEGVSRRRRGE